MREKQRGKEREREGEGRRERGGGREGERERGGEGWREREREKENLLFHWWNIWPVAPTSSLMAGREKKSYALL